MFDKDTLIISYDEKRGEPRGGRKRGTDARAQGLGDCIDCTMCVQVCPTGSTSATGSSTSASPARPASTRATTSWTAWARRAGSSATRRITPCTASTIRVVRPRVVVYACILVGVAATLVVSLVTRTPLILDVIRDRNALYREVRGDRIENAYTLRLINLDDAPHAYRLEVAGLDEAELVSPTGVIEAQPGRGAARSLRACRPELRGARRAPHHAVAGRRRRARTSPCRRKPASSDRSHDAGRCPWHRQFWPWFIIALLALSIAGSLVSAWLAVSHPDVVLEPRGRRHRAHAGTAPMDERCFHCGRALDGSETHALVVDGVPRPMCCGGCEAAARLIHAQGLERYYAFRDGATPPADPAARDWTLFDRDAALRRYSHLRADGRREASLRIDGMHCAACGWLIENSVRALEGVVDVQVNPSVCPRRADLGPAADRAQPCARQCASSRLSAPPPRLRGGS
jgi:ferredoxin